MDFSQNNNDAQKRVDDRSALASTQQLQTAIAQTISGDLKNVAASILQGVKEQIATMQKVGSDTKKVDIPQLDGIISKLDALSGKSVVDAGELAGLLSAIVRAVDGLPKEYPAPLKPSDKIAVINQIDYKKQFEDLLKAVKSLELSPTYNPNIQVASPDVKVNNDFTPVLSKLDDVSKAIGKIKITAPKQTFDDSKIVDALQNVLDAVKSNRPTGGSSVAPSFKNADGTAARASVIVANSVNAIPVVNPDGSTILGGSGSTAATTIASGQVTLSTSAAQVIATRSTRKNVTIVNMSAIDIYLGVTGVTSSTGQLLLGTKGTAVTIGSSAAVFAVSTSGTPSVSYLEEYS